MISVDKQTGELAKSLNISYQEALDLRGELNQAANATGELSISAKGLGEALMAVNSELGITNKTIASLKKADGLVVGSQLCKTITDSLKKRLNTAKVLNKMVYNLKRKII